MAGTHQGTLSEAQGALIGERDTRLTLPEATMFIIASSGGLWVVLYGVVNLLLG